MRAVVFDIGGVLENTPATDWQQRWAARLGLDRATLEGRLDEVFEQGSLGTIDLPTVEREVAAALGLGDDELAALMDDVWTEYLGTLNRELADYFTSLRPRYRTGILSNSFAGAREREQTRYGMHEMCDVIVYSHEEGCRKPQSPFYAIVCERLGVPAGETVFLDDVAANVQGARAVGMSAILFSDNRQAISELQWALGEDR